MVYIEIEDNRITGIYASSSIPDDGRTYREVPACFPGVVGQHVSEFDADWNLRPLEDRLRNKLIPGAERYKAVGDEIIPKSMAELVRDGIEQAPKGTVLDNSGAEPLLRPMSRTELIEAGLMTDSEARRLDLLDEEKTLQAYLSSTDWYAVRLSENGVDIPSEIRSRRQQARDRISEIRSILG
jgi:hypothetical protein